MNRAALRSLARDFTQESSEIPLSTAIINDQLNEAQGDLARRAEYCFAKFLITGGLVTNQYDYAYPPTLLQAWSLAINNGSSLLTPLPPPLTWARMDADFSSWRTDAADRPVRWWRSPNAIWLHPKPSATYASTPLEIYGTRTPPAMGADGDSPTDLPDDFHRLLPMYVAWQWFSIDKESPRAVQMSGYWQKRYLQGALDLKMMISDRDDIDADDPRIEVGRPMELSFPDTPGEPE